MQDYFNDFQEENLVFQANFDQIEFWLKIFLKVYQ